MTFYMARMLDTSRLSTWYSMLLAHQKLDMEN